MIQFPNRTVSDDATTQNFEYLESIMSQFYLDDSIDSTPTSEGAFLGQIALYDLNGDVVGYVGVHDAGS